MKLLRINNGYKVGDVAKALSVSSAYISQCERSKRILSEHKTKRFLDFVGISEDEAKQFVQIMNK
ncbi:helix-turn-helix domain-containing protein [Bacillus paralicheniformis]|uniref:helix-turn-helix domain-containing protein n=1 Tax=Bacillus paralicheniformis TaxID=1648923 RepID=UPI001670C585